MACGSTAVLTLPKEKIDYVTSDETPRIPWDLPAVWSPRPPPYLLALRRIRYELCDDDERDRAVMTCRQLCRTRDAHTKRALRKYIFAELDPLGTCNEVARSMLKD